ncbi:hypothetical protein EVAR_46653_1 [Eumeta japonica]|uniref:Uncharacterized protein n=1 Tax=Eumeta variegata TaxID=151549 RepID=A0A4C1WFV0_EUMVA|nr:hypothetical protein EVAR_46653_1 [Eumeta japonica]
MLRNKSRKRFFRSTGVPRSSRSAGDGSERARCEYIGPSLTDWHTTVGAMNLPTSFKLSHSLRASESTLSCRLRRLSSERRQRTRGLSSMT